MKIATINAMLVANAAGFVAGCKQAEHASEHFAGHSEAIAERMTHIAEAIGLAEVGAKLVEFVDHSIETIEQTKHMADVLGVSAQAFAKLGYAAKLSHVEVESLSGGMTKLLKNMSEAANGTGPAAAAFGKLGLNAADLTKIPVDEAVGRIADGFKHIESPADRVNVAMDIFGKSGAQLLPLLDQGADGLKQFGDEAVKMGVALDDADTEKVEAAGQAMKRVSSLVEGLANTFTVALAPYIEGVADELLDAGVNGTSMSQTITNGVEMVAEGIAQASGTIDLFESAWYVLKGTVIGVAAGIIRIIDDIGSGIVALLNKIPGVSVEWDSMGAVADDMAAQATDAFNQAGKSWDDMSSGKRAQSVREFFDGVKQHAATAAEASEEAAKHATHVSEAAAEGANAITEQIDKLKEELAGIGKTDSQKLADKLKGQGATPEQIAQATALQDQIDKAKEAAKAHDDAAAAAKKYFDDTRTPAEKYAAELERINALVSDHALDEDTAARARAKAQTDLDSATKDKGADHDTDKEPGPAKLLQAGSQEAASFLATFERQGSGDIGKDEAKKTNKKLDTQTDYLRRMYDLANSGGATALTFANVA